MVLTTHAVAGAAVAVTLRSNPWLGLAAAFLSHFILDAVPHWHYPVKRLKRELKSSTGGRLELNKGVLKDLAVIGLDFTLGMAVSAAAGLQFTPDHVLLALAGAIFGVLPDFLQLVYYLFPKTPLAELQRFHMWIHSGRRLDDRRPFGIGSQLLIVAAGIFIMYLA